MVMHGGHDPAGMVGGIEEVGVGETDVAGTGGHQLVDIGQDDVLGHRTDAPVVDDRDRAVPAAVRAAPAGGHRTDETQLPVDGQVGVAAEIRQEPTLGHPGVEASQLDGRTGVGAAGPGHHPGFELAGDNGVAPPARRQIRGRHRVQAEEAEGQAGPPPPHATRHPDGQAHGRVHWHRQGDPFGPVDIVDREHVDRHVGAAHLVARGQ